MDAKDQQKKHWNAVADGWAVWFDWTESNFGRSPTGSATPPAGSRAPASSTWRAALAYPALAAATRVRPGGTVVATDISPEMVAVASRRAKADGFDNIQFIEMDAEQLHFTDASFDAVTNAYGLMFCPEPQRALAEIRRVLKPGGRVALTAWDDPSKSPFFSAISGVAASFLSLQPPNPARPWPLPVRSNWNARDHAARRWILRRSCRRSAGNIRTRFGRRVLRVFRDVAWKGRVASLSDLDLARFREAVSEAARPYADEVSGRLRLAATSLCASGRR